MKGLYLVLLSFLLVNCDSHVSKLNNSFVIKNSVKGLVLSSPNNEFEDASSKYYGSIIVKNISITDLSTYGIKVNLKTIDNQDIAEINNIKVGDLKIGNYLKIDFNCVIAPTELPSTVIISSIKL